MFYLERDMPKTEGSNAIDLASGYALDVPLGIQELPIFWEQNPALVEHIRREREARNIVISDDMLTDEGDPAISESEESGEEIELTPPPGRPMQRPRAPRMERKSDGAASTAQVRDSSRQSRVQDRASTLLSNESTTAKRARAMLYHGTGNFGHAADPILEGWPDPEPLLNPGEGLPKSERDTEEKSTPGVFPAQLRKYWLGKGLSRWATTPTPYRSLVAALRKEGVPGKMVKGLAARLYHSHFGKWPGKKGGKKSFTPRDAHAAMVFETKSVFMGRESGR